MTNNKVESPRGGAPSVGRLEDNRHLKGQACFVADIKLPDMFEVAFLRSVYPHAIIKGIDAREAINLPGVEAVFTAKDFEDMQPIPMRLGADKELIPFLQFPLAVDRVRYVGEPVAVVVAANRYMAEDALDSITVEYEPLGALASIRESVLEREGLLFPEHGSNIAQIFEITVGDVEGALAEAEHVFTETLKIGRQTGMPLETRGLVASFDESTGRLQVWGPTKVPHFNRRILAKLLRMAESDLRFIEPDVGGSFGVRGEFYPEDYLIPAISRILRHPVRWVEDRHEHLMATNHSREQEHRLTVGVNNDGLVSVMIDEFDCDMGAYIRTHGNVVPMCTTAFFTLPYRIPAYKSRFRCVLTNKTPTGTYRAPGRFEGNYVREVVLDHTARKLGWDPVEFRRRHLLRPEDLPWDAGTSVEGMRVIVDPADFPDLLRRAEVAAQDEISRLYEHSFPREKRNLGIGFACFAEKTGTGPYEYAELMVSDDGQIIVATGATNVGQGIETTLALVAAEQLGVPISDIRVIHGDTDLISDGVGSFASRTMIMAGNAVAKAANDLRNQILDAAASAIKVRPEDLGLEGGYIVNKESGDTKMSLWQLAAAQPDPLFSKAKYSTNSITFAGGVHVAIVEVDGETGEVEVIGYVIVADVGRAINEEIVRGQLTGGLAQGIGGALLESLEYDDNAQFLSGSFMDYLIPSPMEVPIEPRVIIVEHPAEGNPLGVRGCGESGIAAAGAAIALAVEDALRDMKVRVSRLPIRPDDLRLQVDMYRAQSHTRATGSNADEAITV